jgi:hypothetical protein
VARRFVVPEGLKRLQSGGQLFGDRNGHVVINCAFCIG